MFPRFVIRSHALHQAFPKSRSTRLGAWGGALVLHVAAALALLLAWPQARDYLEKASPIEVRLLAAPKPQELPAPPPPAATPPLRPAATPPTRVPEAPPPPASPVPLPPVEPPLLAVAGPTASPITVAPAAIENVPVAAPRNAAGPASRSPVAPPPPLVEAHLDANYLSNPKPLYPGISRRQGEAGVVRLRVHVGADGQVLEVELQDSSGYPRLDQAAREAVAHWYFVPARRGDKPVASWVVVPIVFSLT